MQNKLNKQQCIDKLLKSKYALTNHREVILDILLENIDYVLNAEEIGNKVKQIEKTANMATVYRNIQIFEQVGIINKIFLDDKIAYYKICYDGLHHHHLICLNCHKMQDMMYCPDIEFSSIADKNNFLLKYHNIEVFGYCSICKEKNNKI